MAKDPRIARAGVEGFNKPKRTPNHKTKSHVVVAKSGTEIKTIRFGEQGASTAGKPKAAKAKAPPEAKAVEAPPPSRRAMQQRAEFATSRYSSSSCTTRRRRR